MEERPEGAALSGILTVVMGGQAVSLPTLSIAQSERWQMLAGRAMSGIDEVTDPELSAIFDRLAEVSGVAMVALLYAYAQLGACPVTCAMRALPISDQHQHLTPLGEVEAIRETMTQAELYAALQGMVRAEYPFLQDDRITTAALMLASAAVLFVQRSTTNGHSAPGDSTPEDSVTASPLSNSDGSGEPVKNGRRAKQKTAP